MLYLLIGILVSLGSLLIPALIGSLIHKENFTVRVIVSFACWVGYGLLLWWGFWANQIGLFGPAPLFWSILGGAVIAMFIAIIPDSSSETHWKGIWPGAIVGGGYLLYVIVIVLIIGQSPLIHSQAQGTLIGNVKTVSNLNDLIKPADNTHICQVPLEIAKTSAQNALSKFVLKNGSIAGSKYELSEPTKQFVDGSYWWIFPVEFTKYFKWSDDPQVPGYLRVSAENPLEASQAVQTDKNSNEIHVKYLNSAYFGNNAQRYLRYHGYLNSLLEDWTYEVDDNWRPYYTVTELDRTYGFAGKVVKHVITLDLQTGEIKPYEPGNSPKWIDRIIPQDVLDYNTIKWGLYAAKSWWGNLTNGDKAQQPTPGWFLVYNGEECSWLTGFTSTNKKDNALTGFMTLNGRTGNATLFKATGVTESLAYDAAKTLWNNFAGYEPTELVPYNIYGLLTYVIPMKCKDQFSGISLVAMSNINIKAKGENLTEALQSYRDAIVVANSTGLAPESGKVKNIELTGTVEFVGPAITSKTPIISFKLKGVGKIFQASYSDANPKILLIKEGQSVKIAYSETTEVVVSVTNFDIPSVLLEKGSVTQGKYIENNKTTDKEVKRIDDQQKVETIINSDAVKDVDPEALQKFLDDQAAKKAK